MNRYRSRRNGPIGKCFLGPSEASKKSFVGFSQTVCQCLFSFQRNVFQPLIRLGVPFPNPLLHIFTPRFPSLCLSGKQAYVHISISGRQMKGIAMFDSLRTLKRKMSALAGSYDEEKDLRIRTLFPSTFSPPPPPIPSPRAGEYNMEAPQNVFYPTRVGAYRIIVRRMWQGATGSRRVSM